jgi:hypothetical protein
MVIRRLLLLIVPLFLAACGAASPVPTPVPTAVKRQMYTQVPGLSATKLFLLTAEVETQTARAPANDTTITAIIADKHALGTAMAETMTAQPSETPIPAIPAEAPFCQAADLKSSFGSNAATQQILLSAGLTNIGNGPCFLQTWPQVQLLDRQGKPLDVDYGYFDIGIGNAGAAATQRAQEYPTAKVGLWPGWSVWANLIWQNWCGAPVSGGAVIQLTFNHNPGALAIPTDVQAGGTCNAPGQRSTVGIAKLVLVPTP